MAKILLVVSYDNQNFAEAERDLLEAKGYQVLTVEPDESFETQFCKVDLVILCGTGMEFLSAIDSYKGNLPPIIYLYSIEKPKNPKVRSFDIADLPPGGELAEIRQMLGQGEK